MCLFKSLRVGGRSESELVGLFSSWLTNIILSRRVFSNVFCQASNQLVGHGGYVHHSKISTAADMMFKQNACALWQSKMN